MATPVGGIKSQPSQSTARSANVIHAKTIDLRSLIWAEDEEDAWVLVEVLRQENTLLTVQGKHTGEERIIDLGFTETLPQNPKVVADMTALHHIHEPGLLHNLRERANLRKQCPYTLMGTILVAVNPLQPVPNPEMSDCMDKPLNPEVPHPYAIAELAYHQMRLGRNRKVTNQSIVVSGESGAGKTETSKIMLRFLARRSVDGVSGLDQKVVDSNPILEAFGNAKTLRNNNSSRFGKFLKLQFTREKYRLVGALNDTYLLEKSRVLAQGQGERNFHVLYELVAGSRGTDLGDKLKLGAAEDYRILSQGGHTTLDHVDDAEEFRAVNKAFDTIGIDPDRQIQVWQIVASVLHLSSLMFDKVDHEQGEVASVSDREALTTLKELLGVDEMKMKSMLTQRVVTTRGEVFIKQLSVQDAEFTRDAIVKSLYEALFLWIVKVINASLGKGEDSLPFIGVLDIFGFENFDTKNEFEQLLINFTNESLQDTFNKQVFNNEITLYRDEGIEVTVSTCPDNTECLQLLTGKPKGIIPSLDNVCAEPNATDDRYLSGLHRMYSRHPDFPRTAPKDMREIFWVKHYAGKVKYTVEGWVERNMDQVPESFNDTLKSSTFDVVKEVTENYGVAPAGGSRGGRVARTLKKPTVAKAFLKSMQDLNETLLATTCNFVRCIKPNAAMKVGFFDNNYVVAQLQCLGILQTCEVLKVGMPTRVTYTELKEVLGDNAAAAEKLFYGEPETAFIAAILWAFEVPPEVFRLGRTRVFFRAGQISTLQQILDESSADKGPWIFERLQEALANRQKAKAAADQAQAVVTSAEIMVTEAQVEAAKILGEVQDSDEEEEGRRRPRPSPVVDEDELYELQTAAKKAKKAGGTTSQVKDFIQAAEEDEVGKYTKGLMDKVMAASVDTFKAIGDAMAIGKALDMEISVAIGGDTEQEIQKLENTTRKLKNILQDAKGLAVAAEEAAAKCKVEKTEELMEQTKQKAIVLTGQASDVIDRAKSFIQAADKQLEALRQGKSMVAGATITADKAFSALRAFQQLVADAAEEETKAHEAAKAKKRKEEKERRLAEERKRAEERRRGQEKRKADEREEALEKKAAEERQRYEAERRADEEERVKVAEAERMKEEEAEKAKREQEAKIKATNQRLAISINEDEPEGDVTGDLAPSAPSRELLKKGGSQSVKNLLKEVGSLNNSVSPVHKKKTVPRNEGLTKVVETDQWNLGGRITSKRLSMEAMHCELFQGHLIMQSEHTGGWKTRYFVLEDGFFTAYATKALVGTQDCQVMELECNSTTTFTNIDNCLCVRTEKVVWTLMAKDVPTVYRWMKAINAHIHNIFVKHFNVPEDDYASNGLQIQSFYQMVPNAVPQWIRTFPLQTAPRTGDGIFPREVIEVTQVLSNDGLLFLRIADGRGWTPAKSQGDKSNLFLELAGECVDDCETYYFRKDAVPVLFGPGAASQETGEVFRKGDSVVAIKRFKSLDDIGVEYIKLANGRGWIPVAQTNGVSSYPFGWLNGVLTR